MSDKDKQLLALNQVLCEYWDRHQKDKKTIEQLQAEVKNLRLTLSDQARLRDIQIEQLQAKEKQRNKWPANPYCNRCFPPVQTTRGR